MLFGVCYFPFVSFRFNFFFFDYLDDAAAAECFIGFWVIFMQMMNASLLAMKGETNENMKGKECHLFSPGDLISHNNVININRKKKNKQIYHILRDIIGLQKDGGIFSFAGYSQCVFLFSFFLQQNRLEKKSLYCLVDQKP